MALTLDATSTAIDSVADTTFSWSHTCTGTERVLIVTVNINGTMVVNSVTYNSVPLTFIGGVNNVVRGEIWYLIAPDTGANTILVTLASGAQKIGGAQSYTGASQVTPIGTFVSATGSSTAPTVNVTTAVGEGCIDVLSTAATATVGAGQTQIYNSVTAAGLRGCASTEPSLSSPITMSWTLGTSTVWAIGAVNVLPPAAGAFDPAAATFFTQPPSLIEHMRYYEIASSGNATS